jgi:hypothetical protein
MSVIDNPKPPVPGGPRADWDAIMAFAPSLRDTLAGAFDLDQPDYKFDIRWIAGTPHRGKTTNNT